MSASVLSVNDNGDVAISAVVENNAVKVVISQEAFEDSTAIDAERFSELSEQQRENLVAEILVRLSKEEAAGLLKDRYVLSHSDLDSLMH